MYDSFHLATCIATVSHIGYTHDCLCADWKKLLITSKNDSHHQLQSKPSSDLLFVLNLLKMHKWWKLWTEHQSIRIVTREPLGAILHWLDAFSTVLLYWCGAILDCFNLVLYNIDSVLYSTTNGRCYMIIFVTFGVPYLHIYKSSNKHMSM